MWVRVPNQNCSLSAATWPFLWKNCFIDRRSSHPAMTTPMANLAVWPGFARGEKKPKDKTMLNDKWLMTNGGAFVAGATPDFMVTESTIKSEANLASQMWLKHPAYKITLASLQKGADANNDGVIDHDEFKGLLASSGYTGSSADALFASIDSDGDGKLTEAEIKMLSQGSSTLQSAG